MSNSSLDAVGAASYLGVSRATFFNRVRPYVPFVAIGRRRFFIAADLDAFMASQRQAPLRECEESTNAA